MTSTSSLGYTSITLQFALNDDINAAAQLVQTAINAAAGQLPKDMPTPPTYHETNPADAPILVLGLTSDTLPITTVDDYAESILAQKLSQVPGVGLVSIGGEQHPADSRPVQSGTARGQRPGPGGRAERADQCQR